MPKRRITATENVEAVVGRRLCKKTRANYDSKIKLFTDWIRRHESNKVSRFVDTEKDSLISPLPTAVILEFFGHIGNDGYIDVDSTVRSKMQKV